MAFCDRIDRVSHILQRVPQTLIHGDYYPDNTMCLDGRISVFDWEQTAIAPGEIDLASLTNGWHDEVVQATEDAYRCARWPGGAPASFRKRSMPRTSTCFYGCSGKRAGGRTARPAAGASICFGSLLSGWVCCSVFRSVMLPKVLNGPRGCDSCRSDE